MISAKLKRTKRFKKQETSSGYEARPKDEDTIV